MKNAYLSYNFFENNNLQFSYTNSSYDRTGANVDYDTWLYEENDGKVIMDVKGQGCITRIFLPTSGKADSFLKIYVDDKLFVNDIIDNIFNGKNAKFPCELINITNPKENKIVEQSGYTSYVQIPFNSHIKILSDCPSLYYYHINYVIYNSEKNNLLSNKDYINAFVNVGKSLNNDESMQYTIEQYSQCNLLSLNKSGKINSLRIKINNSIEKTLVDLDGCPNEPYYADCITKTGYSILNNLIIKVEFDDQGECINTPLSYFFGFSAFGADDKAPDYKTKAVFCGIDEDEFFYFNFPIAFNSCAKITLVNTGNQTANIIFDYDFEEYSFSDEIMYLNAKLVTVDYKEDDNRDMKLLNLNGSGALVGVVMSMDTDGTIDKNKQYLEGDEHIYVDGSLTPQHNGTGTEDFFNGAYYWAYGTYSAPLSGCMYNTRWGKYSKGDEKTQFKSSAYRYLINDRICFNESLEFNMEHGSWSDSNTSREFGSFLFLYYFNSKSRILKKDSVLAQSNKLVTSQYEGYAYGENKTLSIETLSNGEKKVINISVPKNTSSIALRRICDYSVINQQADIFINGKYCGVWLTAGINETMKFHSTEFIIKKEFIDENIKIEIIATSNEFNYSQLEVLCIR